MRDFWKAAAIRAVRTFCQTAIAILPASFAINDVNWLVVIATAAGSAVLSVLTSIATGLPEVEGGEDDI